MQHKRKLVLAIVISAVVTFAATTVLYFSVGKVIPAVLSKVFAGRSAQVSLIGDVKRYMDYFYLDKVDDAAMLEAGAKAMAQSVGDPYTKYYNPEEFSRYKEGTSGDYVGVGIILSVKEQTGEIVVVAPYDNSPGARAGVLPGDIILAVDGQAVTGDMLNETAKKMRGTDIANPNGTQVSITVRRDSGEPFDLTLTRSHIEMITVKASILQDGIGWLRITGFDSDTDIEVSDALASLQQQGMTRLVLDLRDNPGGDLNSCCRTAGKFLQEGDVITYTEDKSGKREYYKAEGASVSVPMTLLINGGSASASEVLTGALRDHGRIAAIIGTKSFGKGIVQGVYPLPSGGGMTITMAKYYSPSGECIHGIGIQPDTVVEMPGAQGKLISQLSYDEDIQLQKGVQILKK